MDKQYTQWIHAKSDLVHLQKTVERHSGRRDVNRLSSNEVDHRISTRTSQAAPDGLLGLGLPGAATVNLMGVHLPRLLLFHRSMVDLEGGVSVDL